MASILPQDWRGDIQRLNPWLAPYLDELQPAYATPLSIRTAAADRARADAARRRMAGGRTGWNRWATVMLGLLPRAAETPRGLRLWDYAATVELNAGDPLDLVGLILPGACRLAGATLPDYFCASHAEFFGPFDARNAVFLREAAFECATFHREAGFDNAVFREAGQFRQARFLGTASFRGVDFQKEAWFRRASFGAPFDATGASFAADAGFGECRFHETSDFSGGVFKDHAGFDKAIFEKPARFCGARFVRNAWFRGAQMDGATSFDRARFAARIDFEGVGVMEARPSPVAEMIRTIERRWRAMG
ncbi:pentapeptide repeat-containing protein [Methylocystis sp. JAN1]|uniref:pentapeptide repeat-containing protein n=1 Tax=Methylocystis sp. JAN1 TaxID=3397211 RepID=UPI003FA2AEDC